MAKAQPVKLAVEPTDLEKAVMAAGVAQSILPSVIALIEAINNKKNKKNKKK